MTKEMGCPLEARHTVNDMVEVLAFYNIGFLLSTIEDHKVDGKSVHQSPKITFHFIVLITTKYVSCMLFSDYINTDWWLKFIYKTASSATCVVFPLIVSLVSSLFYKFQILNVTEYIC